MRKTAIQCWPLQENIYLRIVYPHRAMVRKITFPMKIGEEQKKVLWMFVAHFLGLEDNQII